MVAVEARGDALLECWVGQQIASQLLNDELIEGQIAVECFDHPIAPAPHVPLAVLLIAVCICITRRIEPAESHPFAVTRRSEQTINHFFVSVRRLVVEKIINLWWRGRQAGQIERQAADQCRTICFR